MPEELCQVCCKSHYGSLALHSDPSPYWRTSDCLFGSPGLLVEGLHCSPIYPYSWGNPLKSAKSLIGPTHRLLQSVPGLRGSSAQKNISEDLYKSLCCQTAFNLLTLKTSLSVWTRRSMQSTWRSVSKNWQRCLFAIVARRLGTLQGVEWTFIPTENHRHSLNWLDW